MTANLFLLNHFRSCHIVNLNAIWFRRALGREALGAVVHEMVHVVQNYGKARRDNPKPAPAPAVPVAPPPPPPKAVDVYNFAEKGFHFEATVPADKVVEAAQILDRHGFAIDAVTGMDWLDQGLMEVVYDFLHFPTGLRAVVKARIPRAKPEIATISGVFPGANWHERETHDMYGIDFIGHPDMTPFLLPDDANYHPLRKDFHA